MSAGPYAVTRAGPGTIVQTIVAAVLIASPIAWMVHRF
jgi:hypothetical protein